MKNTHAPALSLNRNRIEKTLALTMNPVAADVSPLHWKGKEVADRSATDCDGHGVPDECELGDLAVIYVDLNNRRCQNGSEAHPFGTVEQAHARATAGDTLRIRSGRYPEKVRLFRAVRLEAVGGPVTIGG